MITKRIHNIYGIIISLYISFHLVNHFFSVFGVEKHIEIMNSIRLVYRNIFVEIILLSAVVIQIVSGIKMVIQNRKKAISKFEKLSIYSGLYLAFFFIVHIGAVMIGRIILKLDTNIYFGAAGLNIFPLNLFFIPYYVIAIMSFFCHVACIHNKKMNKNILGLTPINQSIGIILLGVLVIIVIFYGLTNHFNGMIIPNEYKLN
jgi:hypothetical protein